MLARIFREMYGEVSPVGKFWLYVGTVILACAMIMSFKFGWSLSLMHALGLALIGVFTAFIPDTAVTQWREGRQPMAIILGIIAIPLFFLEFQSHAGYTSGLRGVNTTEAKVQNTKWKGNQDSVVQEKTDLKRWEERRDQLLAQKGWHTTMTSEALEAKLAGAELAISLEAKRGGCKSRCLERTRERDDIKSAMALAAEKKALDEKIEGVKRVLANAHDTANNTEYKVSAVELQNQFIGRFMSFVSTGSLEPTEYQREAAEFSISNGMALGLTGLPSLAFLLAGLYRRQEPKLKIGGGIPNIVDDFWSKYKEHCSKQKVDPIPAT